MSKVQAQIISIGDELLLGETINTNASFIAKSLQRIGIEVSKIWTIADVEGQMIDTIKSAARETSLDRKSTRLNSSHVAISYAVFCLKKKNHKALNGSQ